MADRSSQEVEFKWGLPSRVAFEKFVQAMGGEGCETVRQVNHFFDTDDLRLHRAQHNFRLRVAQQKYLVTLKGPSSVSGDLTVRSEIEWNVPQTVALGVLDEQDDPRFLVDAARDALTESERNLVDRLLSPAQHQPLVYIGHFENQRTLVSATLSHQGQELCAQFEFDETSFDADEAQYEVELEVSAELAEAYGAAVRGLMQDLGIVPIQRMSKSRRFFDHLHHKRALT